MNQNQNGALRIAQFLPWTLLFPIGVTYVGFMVFIVACLVQPDRGAWARRISTHPMLIPIISLSLISTLIALYHGPSPYHPADFVSSWSHYQIYLFLLPFLGFQTGAWQVKARQQFIWTALAIAGLLMCAKLGLLPDHKFFKSFTIYEGNKSILLALCIALGAAWLWDLSYCRVLFGRSAQTLNDSESKKKNETYLQWAILIFLVAALILFNKSRTALLLFVLLLVFSGFQCLGRRGWLDWRAGVVALLMIGAFVGGWQYISKLERPPVCEIRKVQASPLELARIRLVCTVQQVNEFSQGKSISEDGIRLELYYLTSQIIADSPWIGHGVGSWLGLYERKAAGRVSQDMTTPHNEFLLFMTEIGLLGLLPLLWIWWTQIRLAWRVSIAPADRALHLGSSLAMLSVGILFCACFNAAVRDLVFAIPFLMLSGYFMASLHPDEQAAIGKESK